MVLSKLFTLKAPGAMVVVFRSGPHGNGPFAAVNEKHIVAFAPPLVLIQDDALRDSQKVTLAGSFKEYAVISPFPVLLFGRGPAWTRSQLSILSMKIAHSFREARKDLIVAKKISFPGSWKLLLPIVSRLSTT
jgi:hypothetical protein